MSLLLAGCFDPSADRDTDLGASSDGTATGASSGVADDNAMTDADGTTGAGTQADTSADTVADDTTLPDSGDDDPLPMCDGPNQACIAEAPNGWAGPTIVYRGAPDDLPQCPSAAPDVSIERNQGLSSVPAVCGCECGDPAAPKCPGAALLSHDSSTCDGATQNTALAPDTCAALPSALSHNVISGIPPTAFGGTCDASATVELAEPTWAETVRACIGQPTPAADCDADQVCVQQPQLAPPFRVCVHRAGEQSCPLAGYTDRIETFGDFADDRDCTDCGCSAVQGGQCVPTLAFYGSNDCSGGTNDTLMGGGFQCSQVSGSGSARLEIEIAGSCTPDDVMPIGEVFPSIPETFCCLPV